MVEQKKYEEDGSIPAERALVKYDILGNLEAEAEKRANTPHGRMLAEEMGRVIDIAHKMPRSVLELDTMHVVSISRASIRETMNMWRGDLAAESPLVRARAREFTYNGVILPASLKAMENIAERAISEGKRYVKYTPHVAAHVVANNSVIPAAIKEESANCAKDAYFEIRKEKAELETTYDDMTGLPKYSSVLPVMLDFIKRGKPFVYLNLDFNLMKNYNSAFGHPFVDDLLRLSAHILQNSLRGDDLPYRRGDKADEFGGGARVSNYENAVFVARKIFQALGQVTIPFPMDMSHFDTMRENRDNFLNKVKSGKTLKAQEAESLALIEHFAARHGIDLSTETSSRQSWDCLPEVQRHVEREEGKKRVEPSFGWTLGAAFYDPESDKYSGMSPMQVISQLEHLSEAGVNKLKIDRPEDRFAMVDGEGESVFIDRNGNLVS